MLARNLVSDMVPYLKTTDTGMKALTWMEVFKVSHLPIVKDIEFLGLISDTDIYDMNMADEAVGNHKLSLITPYVNADQHIYEVIDLAVKQKISVIPVLENNKKYHGLITIHKLLENFAELAAIQNPGGIIVLELNNNDYSLTQIAQIVEGNDAKILSVYIKTLPETNIMQVTLKLNIIDLEAVIQTFERYNYNIVATYLDNTNIESMYQSRYEEFLHYLNI